MRNFGHLVTGLALGTALVGCKGETDDGDNSATGANIVVVVPLTGTFATKGLLHQNAVIMAMQQLSDGGFTEKTGISISLTPVNSGDGETATDRVANVAADIQALIDANTTDDGNVAITGFITSTADAHQGTAPLAATYGIPTFEASNGAGEDEFMVHQDGDHPDGYTDEQLSFMFGTRPLCDFESDLTAQLIVEKWQGQKVAIMHGNETHDKMHSVTLKESLTALGFTGTVVLSGDTEHNNDFILDYNDTSFQDDIQAVKDAHSPDMIFFHLRGDSNNLRFLQDAKAADFQGMLPTCGMARGTALIDNTQNGGISDYLTDRLYFVMRGPQPSDALTAFKNDYKALWAADGLEADTFTPMMYDATQLLMLATASVGDTADHEGIRDAIRDTSQTGTAVNYGGLGAGIDAVIAGTDVDLNGVSGPLDVRDDNSVPGSFYVEEVVDSGDGSFKYNELTTPARITN